jgi:N-carbamoyl-L-amino-acid hydrolase
MVTQQQHQAIQSIIKQADTLLQEKHFRAWIDGIGSIGLGANGGVTRLAFSDEDLKIRGAVMTYMESHLGLEVRYDAWGNIFGRRRGMQDNVGVLQTGSHLDTVRNGGKYDGAAGVFCGLEMIRLLNELDIQTIHPIEVVVFAAEEANQSGISTIGSRGVSGRVKRKNLKPYSDDQGVPLLDAIQRAGGEPSAMNRDVYRPGDVRAYIEIHNEQMPRLEKSGADLGVVLGVTGIRRRRFAITGSAGHGGTILMEQRQDALVAAAEIISAVYNAALGIQGDCVATVGHISVEPNSVNVVPGSVILEMEIRSYIPEEIDAIDKCVWETATTCQKKYGVSIHRSETIYDNAPREFSPLIRRTLTHSCELLNYSSQYLVSMAGHDAYHMSTITDSGMIFVPSRNGRSHCADEFTAPESLVKATLALTTALKIIDQEDS